MSNPKDFNFEGHPGTGMGYGLNELQAKLAELLEGQGFNVEALDTGSKHPYDCRCETCWNWWKMMGLGDEDSPPFTQAELDQETFEMAINVQQTVPEGSDILAINELVLDMARAARKADPCGHGDHQWRPMAGYETLSTHYYCPRCGKVYP